MKEKKEEKPKKEKKLKEKPVDVAPKEESVVVPSEEKPRKEKIELKLFGKWKFDGVKVTDPGLRRYVNLKPIMVPRTSGIYEEKKFWKSKMSVVERLINKLMVPGHRRKKHWWTSKVCSGKSHTIYNFIQRTFDIIHERTNENPLQVLVRAIEQASPREEITAIESGGIRHPKAVDISPQRRVDLVLRWIVQGSFARTVNKKTSIEKVLADEIILAAQNDTKSKAVSRKIESERQAAASR